MAFAKAARKLKRAGKVAHQFRCTSVFEYIELVCNEKWRPDQLRIVWQRNSRKVNTIPVRWEAIEDRGPLGASGKAMFDVKLEATLIITLYEDAKQLNYDAKEYRYYIENIGPKGVKQLASFTCNMADFVAVPNSRHELVFNFQCISEKVSMAQLGITLDTEFLRKGTPDDLQSTFSSVSLRDNEAPLPDDEDESKMEKEIHSVQTETSQFTDQKVEILTQQEFASMEKMLKEQESKKMITQEQGAVMKPVSMEDKEHGPVMEPVPMKEKEHGPVMEPAPIKEKEHGQVMELAPIEQKEVGQMKEMLVPMKEKEHGSGMEPAPMKEKEHGPVMEPAPMKEKEQGPGMEPAPMKEKEHVPVMEPVPMKEKEHGPIMEPAPMKEKEQGPGTEPAPMKEKEHVPVMEPVPMKEKEHVPVMEPAPMREKEHGSVMEPVSMKEKELGPVIELAPIKQKEDRLMKEVLVPMKEKEHETVMEPVKEEEDGLMKDEPVPMKEKEHGPAMKQAPLKLEVQDTMKERGPVIKHILGDEKEQGAVKEQRLITEAERGPEPAQMKETQQGPMKEPEVIIERVPIRDKEQSPMKGHRQVIEHASEVEKGQGPVQEQGLVKGQEQQKLMIISDIEIKSNPLMESDSIMKQDSRILGEACLQAPTSDPTHSKGSASEASSLLSGRIDTGETSVASWLSDCEIIDCDGTAVPLSVLVKNKLIALYFSASWCHPCQRFFPKLHKFYSHLKMQEMPFEVLYISSDHSAEDMSKYIKEKAVPWLAVKCNHPSTEKMRLEFGIEAIPVIIITTPSGIKVENSVIKRIAAASETSALSLELFKTWLGALPSSDGVPYKEQMMKSSVYEQLEKENTQLRKEVDMQRQQIAQLSSRLASVTKLEEEVSHHYQKENSMLKIEIEAFKQQISTMTGQLIAISKKDDELKQCRKANSWLYKQGVKGLTANTWRRRFFRIEDFGGKMVYYKNPTDALPQGFIEIDKVTGVNEGSTSQQDRAVGAFQVHCEGRTYDLRAHSNAEMNMWISTIRCLHESRLTSPT